MADYRTKSSSLVTKANALKKRSESYEASVDKSKIVTTDNGTEKKSFLENSTSIGSKVAKFAIEFELVAKALNLLSAKLHNANMKDADELYNNAWFIMSETTLCRRLWSKTELTKWVTHSTASGKMKIFCDRLSSGVTLFQKVKGAVDICEPIIKKVIHLTCTGDFWENQISVPSEGLDSCTKIKIELKNGVSKINEIIKLIEPFNELAPRGIKEYNRYVIEAFKEAQKVFDIADEYSDLILKLSEETSSWYQVINDNRSWYAATQALRQNIDINVYLDYLERMERSRPEINRQLGAKQTNGTK